MTTAPTRPRRDPVPSARQQAAAPPARPGEAAQPVTAADALTAELAAGGRRTGFLRGLIRDADPRRVAGEEPMRPVLTLGIVDLMKGGGAAVLQVSTLAIILEIGISDDTFRTIGVASVLLGTFFSIFVAWIADRVPRLAVLAVGSFLFGLTSVVGGLEAALLTYVVAVIGHELTGNLIVTTPVKNSLLADWYPPERRGRVFAFLASVGTLGGILLLPVVGVAVEVFGWRTGLFVTGVFTIAATALYGTLREPARGRWDRLRLGASEQAASHEQQKPSLGEAIRIVRSVATLRRMCFANAFLGASGLVLYPIVLLILLRAAGTNAITVALIIAVQRIMTLIGIQLGGVMADRLLNTRPALILQVLGWTFVVNIGLLLVIASSENRWLLLTISVLQALVSQAPTTAQGVLASLVTPARVRSFGIAIPPLYGLLGMLVILPFVSVFDSTSSVVVVGCGISVVGALAYITASSDVDADMRAARAAVLAQEASARAGTGDALLVCRDVEVEYDGVQVLFGVSLDLREGELVALLGTNGAGKSTLLRALTGLSEPSGGAIFVDGVDATHLPPHEIARLGVVFMPGGRGVFPTLTVDENLSLAGASADPARLARVFELFPQLVPRRGTLAGNLSGGEQQMVALGQAMLVRPRLLLVDELSLGLAPAVVEQLLQALTALHDAGTTVILVEQSVDLALTVAERAVFMEKGEIRYDGPAAELRDHPELLRSIYVRGTRATAVTSTRARAPRDTFDQVALGVRGVSVSYGGVAALTDAELDVAPGEIVGLIGPNGAGKTTLFDAVCGFVATTNGVVWLNGRDVGDEPPGARAALGLARSFQDARLFSALTVTENVMVSLHTKATAAAGAVASALWLPQARGAEAKLRRRAETLVDAVGLGEHRDKVPAELSTGMRRVLDLACCMAVEPDVLLLDEPSSGIAQAEAEELAPLLDRIRRDLGCGILLIEHDMSLLTAVADRLVGMVLGRTVVAGSVTEVTSDPRMIAAYLGTSERVLARSGPAVKENAT